jgi:hypothetical protein
VSRPSVAMFEPSMTTCFIGMSACIQPKVRRERPDTRDRPPVPCP